MAIWFSDENTSHLPLKTRTDMNDPISFLEIFFSEGETSLRNRARKSKAGTVLWKYVACMGVFFLAGMLIWHITGQSPLHRLSVMMDKEDYRSATALAHNILLKTPDNKNVRNMSEESLLKEAIRQGWMARLENKRFKEARVILAKLNQEIPNISKTAKTLTALNWITDLEQYAAEREPESQVIMFQDEIPIESLLKEWKSYKDEVRHVLGLLSSYVEKKNAIDDDPIHSIYSHLNMLQNTKSLYLGEIERLKRYIRQELDKDRVSYVASALETFKRKYPGIEGIVSLDEDLAAYIKMEQMIRDKVGANNNSPLQDKDLQKISDIKFHTPVFADKAKQLIAYNRASTGGLPLPREDEQAVSDDADIRKYDEGSISLHGLKILSKSPEDKY